jgi:PAS domain S-box-containing protein
MNILLIEDDAGLVELITANLEESGYSVMSAASGAEALAHLKKQTPNLMLLDYSLPDINGKELIETLNNKQMPLPPFIITTGQGDERIAVNMMKLGAMDYLIKDILFLEKLPNVVQRVIKEIESDGKLKQAEEALQVSEIRFRALHNASFGGIAIHNEGLILDCNQGLSEISGYKVNDLIGMDGLLLIAEESRELVRGNILAKYEKPYKAIGIKKNGEKYPLRLSARMISYKGQMARVVEFRDITDSVIAEKALKQSEERFKLAMAASKDGLYDWDLVTNEIYYSPGWKSMLGYEDNELPNDFTIWEKLTEPEDVKKSWEMQQELINKKRDRFELEFKMKHKKGHWVDILSRAEATFDDKGKAIRIVGTHVDITERKQEEKILDVELKLFEYAINHSQEELLQKFLDEAEELTNSKIGFYHYIENDQESISLQTWSTNTLNNMCKGLGEASQHYPISKAGVWVDCVKERKPVVHNDYSSLDHKKGLPEGHAPIIRELVVPVIRGNQIMAVLGVGNKESDYTETDVKSVQRLADVAWETVVRKQAEEKTHIAEETVRISEKYYKNIINNMGDPVFVKDDQSKFLLVNDAFCKIVDIPRAEIIGRTLAEDIPPEEMENFLKIDKQVIIDGKDKITEESLTVRDGKTLTISTRKTRFVDNNDKRFLVGVIRDFTEKKQAEDTLRETNARHSAMIENIGDVIGIIGADGMTKYQSPNIEKLFGWKPEDLIGKNGWDLIHPEDNESIQKEFNKLLEKETASLVEFRFKCKDGVYKWIELTAVNRLNDPSINGVLLNFHDMTEKKQTEIELINSRKNLELLVKQRTMELEKTNNELVIQNTELERFNKLFIDREFRIKELRDKVKELEGKK